MSLKQLQDAKNNIKDCRKGSIRAITRTGVLSHFGGSDDFLISAINELWDLVCDVAERRIDEAIKVEANKMIEEAQKVLK